ALGGSIAVGGENEPGVLAWQADDQIDDAAKVDIYATKDGSSLLLQGRREQIGSLNIHRGAKVDTGTGSTGVLSAEELIVEGKTLAKGVYTSSEPWLKGSGYVVVGKLSHIDVEGVVKDPSA